MSQRLWKPPLARYRRDVLGLRQSELAEMAHCQQAWISQVECGHLPEAWSRADLLKAYRLKETRFVRLVLLARKEAALQGPLSEDMPLFAVAEGGERATPEALVLASAERASG
jgi:transcriptional regulator with XRE-family HTH domain